MQTKTPYEDKILKEVRDLPDELQEKLVIQDIHSGGKSTMTG